jgi:hypothetical protein
MSTKQRMYCGCGRFKFHDSADRYASWTGGPCTYPEVENWTHILSCTKKETVMGPRYRNPWSISSLIFFSFRFAVPDFIFSHSSRFLRTTCRLLCVRHNDTTKTYAACVLCYSGFGVRPRLYVVTIRKVYRDSGRRSPTSCSHSNRTCQFLPLVECFRTLFWISASGELTGATLGPSDGYRFYADLTHARESLEGSRIPFQVYDFSPRTSRSGKSSRVVGGVDAVYFLLIDLELEEDNDVDPKRLDVCLSEDNILLMPVSTRTF